MVTVTRTMSAADPRSGCARMAAAGSAISSSGTAASRRPSFAGGVSEKCLAHTSTMASFANSDGCTDIGPSRIQRREPPPTWPISGTASTTSRATR
jgi:hypothetical protein